MVELNEFSKNVQINIQPSLKNNASGMRVSGLLDDVIKRLPDEEQFKTKGNVWVYKRKEAIDFWNVPRGPGELYGYRAPFENPAVDGHCVFLPVESHTQFDIFIIVDGYFDLDTRTDNYILGVIAWEFGRLTHYWKKTKKISNSEQDSDNAAKEEAIRLGFENEIQEMMIASGWN